MQRRAFMTGMPTVAAAAAAQSLVVLSPTQTLTNKAMDTAVLNRGQEYEICKVRGHVATISGNMHGMTATLTTLNLTADAPARKYTTVEESAWETCFHCGTRYRWVNRLEEIRPE